ncbi:MULTISPECIES: DUF2169 domain-containing protein [unclassified Mesorhizobium]|uniref:DUF2169 family type VI secretion system accessory protein n=1 Tax=unclassified Mesorhizobium TaxID=325217 RepID=UPI00112C286D|nr:MULTISPECIES: DUF2169 domain-containing protein [unclassified Mesorhizobium]MBZ9973982.1 DUF2169 domain-containing protein [Mesorhizobium sp. BR-1-1-10]TPK10490.1 DUF2169 domain-containing protein [Mesorhizobium sp. B2-5-7]
MFAVWVENRTPFLAGTFVQANAEGNEIFLAVFSASFDVAQGATQFQPAVDQLPVSFGDIPFGNPACSSVRYEGEIAWVKPGVDVVLNGQAHAPRDRPVHEMQVGLKVAGIRKVLNVTGDRLYDTGAYSKPYPFTRMPVIYERAFGGTDDKGRTDPRNPLGVGFNHARSADKTVKTHAPNITYVSEPFLSVSDRPKPAAFGVIGRGWHPRLPLAGTYDQAWIDNQWPLPPTDFDPRYNLCAPADQQLPGLNDGEDVSVIGMTPDGRWNFRLPRVVAPIRLLFDDRAEDRVFQVDTVIIEPDLRRVTLKSRLAMVTKRNAPALREIIFGHVTPAFLLARRKRKVYVGPRGDGGLTARRATWLA